ncbi:hypothetical protein L211DRAFT_525524 [Terfezia boudieri ATCC MYA-4762]|uniref:Uncharacterized protein n=1 Tax=Terfezia boudieri ATCC MYA-4762 TaxID=1051890 RepID=A0A3N4LG25_9PEZI|nr:hypothetical protein L211DRAFT_525524 [Terfezia boudieri ATCC MYA-4762]
MVRMLPQLDRPRCERAKTPKRAKPPSEQSPRASKAPERAKPPSEQSPQASKAPKRAKPPSEQSPRASKAISSATSERAQRALQPPKTRLFFFFLCIRRSAEGGVISRDA